MSYAEPSLCIGGYDSLTFDCLDNSCRMLESSIQSFIRLARNVLHVVVKIMRA